MYIDLSRNLTNNYYQMGITVITYLRSTLDNVNCKVSKYLPMMNDDDNSHENQTKSKMKKMYLFTFLKKYHL